MRATLCLLTLLFVQTVVAAAPKVESFSPAGSVKQVRQVAARFSESMVALGDPRLVAPFVVDCAAPGHGRWVDVRHWVYD